MTLESKFKEVFGEDITEGSKEITAICNVYYPVDWDKVAKAFHEALLEVTSEDIEKVINDNPALTENEYNEND